MNNKEEKVQCQKLWANNKYLVLSHSSKIYLEIRTYLKQEEVSLSKVVNVNIKMYKSDKIKMYNYSKLT